MRFTVKVEGVRVMLTRFLQAEHGLLDLRGLGTWKAVAAKFRKIEKQIFDSEGAESAGGKWKALSPRYAKWKLKHYGDIPILQRTGRFYKSMTTGSHPDSVLIEEKQEMAVGSSVPYGKYHQSTEPRTRLPRRAPISLTREHRKEITDIVQQKLRQLMANARLAEKRGF